MNWTGRIMTAIATGFDSGRDAWNQYGSVNTSKGMMRVYSDRWAWYEGTIFNEVWRKSPYRGDVRVYKNVSLLFKHVEAVVDFYATTVYQGALSTDGMPLPDGTKGAIPIAVQVQTEEQEAALRLVISELLTAWNYRQQMSLRPMYTAALGDCLTELVDDLDRAFVYPQIVWPGYVKDIELDYVGNVLYYAVEYPIVEVDDNGVKHPYVFRKEVDKESFRYYKNGQPFDYYGDGAEEVNPYGFVPAVWDRHRIGWDERGGSAIDGTRQALMQVNSLLSHSFDFQRKAFLAPIMVKGLRGGSKRTVAGQRIRQIAAQVSRPPTPTDESDDEVDGLAETYGVVPVGGDNPTLLQPTFDVGKTLEIIKTITEGVVDENPEARFYKEIRQLSQLSGPGVERALGDAASRCNRARSGLDTNLIKKVQMAITMGAIRANNGDWEVDDGGNRRRMNRRQRAFLPFSLDSYHNGELDFLIEDRPVVPPTEQERLDLIRQREAIRTRWGLLESGLDEDEVDDILLDSPASAFNRTAAVDAGVILP